MSAEPAASFPQPRRPRRRPRDHLHNAVLALAGGNGAIIAHREQPWASTTFTGSRHHLTIIFNGNEAVKTSEKLIVALPEHEFTIPGQLVADAAVTNIDSVMFPEARITIECELLLLTDT